MAVNVLILRQYGRIVLNVRLIGRIVLNVRLISRIVLRMRLISRIVLRMRLIGRIGLKTETNGRIDRVYCCTGLVSKTGLHDQPCLQCPNYQMYHARTATMHDDPEIPDDLACALVPIRPVTRTLTSVHSLACMEWVPGSGVWVVVWVGYGYWPGMGMGMGNGLVWYWPG